jgi:hypothetical protein
MARLEGLENLSIRLVAQFTDFDVPGHNGAISLALRARSCANLGPGESRFVSLNDSCLWVHHNVLR